MRFPSKLSTELNFIALNLFKYNKISVSFDHISENFLIILDGYTKWSSYLHDNNDITSSGLI